MTILTAFNGKSLFGFLFGTLAFISYLCIINIDSQNA